MVYIVDKSVTFWNGGTFSLTSSVQEVNVIFKWKKKLAEARQSIAGEFQKSRKFLKNATFLPYLP